MVRKKIQKFLYTYLFPYGGLFLVRLVCATYRIRIMGSENEKQFLDENRGLIYASWHQRFFPGITFFCKRKPIAIMISKSRDGEMAARAVDILGWLAVRGSSSKGGKDALDKIKRLSETGYKIGHIVDGPQGPLGKVKPGLIRIAQHSGLPIVPTITSARNKWVFNSWDRFMVPRPFSPVIIRFGKPVYVPNDLDEGGFEALRLDVERRLETLYKDTDAIWQANPRAQKSYT